MLGQATYLAFLIPWAGLVVALHWLVGAPELRARYRWVALAALISTLYLSAADRFALGDGIWTINPARSTGIHVAGLPMEEALFFLLTNLMVAQSVALLTAPELTPRVVWERLLSRVRAVSGFLGRFGAAWPVGAAAASLAALVASIVAAVLDAPTALDAPWQLIMVWTPVPVAAWLIDSLGDASRPLGLIGAFALYLIVGGALGTLARLGRGWLIVSIAAAIPLGLWLGGGTWPLPAALLALGPLAAALLPDSAPSPQPSPRGRGGEPNPLPRFPTGEGGTDVPLASRGGGADPFLASPSGRGRAPRRPGEGGAQSARALTPTLSQRERESMPTPIGEGGQGVRPVVSRRGLVFRLMPALAAAGLGLVWLAERRIRGGLVESSGAPIFEAPEVTPRAAGFPVAGQPPEVTPIDDFYVVSKNVDDPAPLVDVWRLKVGGRVDRSFEVDYVDLTGRERVDQYTTLRCVSNPVGWPLMSNGLWSGVPLAAILDEAGVRPDARWVVARGTDGHHEDLPLAVALAPDTLVAYALNGSLLERRHGYPARLVVPGHYGFKNVKWLESIEVLADDQPGLWPSRGWTHEGVMVSAARIDVARREGSSLLVAGVALAGTRGVRRVDVRTVDESGPGGWRAADLNQPPLGRGVWVQWRVEVPAPAGGRVEARAVDGQGNVQDEAESGPFPNGATGLDSVEVPK